MKFALQEVIERILWDPSLKEEIPHIKIRYIHRGAPQNRVEVYFSELLRIERGYLVLPSGSEGLEEDFIPFHRVELVWNENTGHIFYHKRKKGDNAD